MDPSTRIVLSWLSTQVCPCGATGEFDVGNVRYMSPLLYDATCRVCKSVRECYGEGMRVIEEGATEATRKPPQWVT